MFAIWVVSLYCCRGCRLVGVGLSFVLCHFWCGCRLVGNCLPFGLCHFCVGLAAGWWAMVCHLCCVTFVLVWLPVGGRWFVIWVVRLLCCRGCRLAISTEWTLFPSTLRSPYSSTSETFMLPFECVNVIYVHRMPTCPSV